MDDADFVSQRTYERKANRNGLSEVIVNNYAESLRLDRVRIERLLTQAINNSHRFVLIKALTYLKGKEDYAGNNSK